MTKSTSTSICFIDTQNCRNYKSDNNFDFDDLKNNICKIMEKYESDIFYVLLFGIDKPNDNFFK